MSGARFSVLPTGLDGLVVLERRPIGDDRGFLERMFCDRELQPVLGGGCIEAVNRTHTKSAATVRGLHYQRAPHGELKIVTCLRGAVFDVAVDLRKGSSTFMRWHAERLTEDNRRSLLIPRGFAHGLQTLVAGCEMLYFHTAPHHPDSEGGIDALDPALGIPGPLAVGERSPRDCALPRCDHPFEGIEP